MKLIEYLKDSIEYKRNLARMHAINEIQHKRLKDPNLSNDEWCKLTMAFDRCLIEREKFRDKYHQDIEDP